MADLESGSKSVAVVEDSSQQQRSDQAAAAPSTTKGKFKIYGKVVMAMKRFQGSSGHGCWQVRPVLKTGLTNSPCMFCPAAASLNPTYSYGKRTSDSSAEQVSTM
jgi:hypothetical protein